MIAVIDRSGLEAETKLKLSQHWGCGREVAESRHSLVPLNFELFHQRPFFDSRLIDSWQTETIAGGLVWQKSCCDDAHQAAPNYNKPFAKPFFCHMTCECWERRLCFWICEACSWQTVEDVFFACATVQILRFNLCGSIQPIYIYICICFYMSVICLYSVYLQMFILVIVLT